MAPLSPVPQPPVGSEHVPIDTEALLGQITFTAEVQMVDAVHHWCG
jgi:hypothetical protein